jgi:hypothetical protein
MPYPAQLQGPALPKSVSCYVLLLFRVAIAQVFNICSTLKMQGNVQLSYYHAALVLSIKKARSSAVEKFNSQMQQLFTFIFVHFITPQQGRQHTLFCWQPIITPILLSRLYHITPF